MASVVDTLREELTTVSEQAETLGKRKLALEQAIALLEGNLVLVAPADAELPKTDFKGLSMSDAAQRFIHELGGEPQTTGDIAKALLSRGFETKAKNFVATVYSTLTNSKAFKRTKDGRWEPIADRG